METIVKKQELLNSLSTANVDQLKELDIKLVALIKDTALDELPDLLRNVNASLAANQSLSDSSLESDESPSERGGLDFDIASHGQGGNWKANSGGISSIFGDIVKVRPHHYGTPQNVDDVISLVKQVPENSSIDVLGAGLSLNGLYAQHGRYLMLTSGLQRSLPLDNELYHKNPKEAHYYQTEAGVRIPKLLDDINTAEMALSWGGYTPQSLVGAAATSTHKSGFLPPLVDFILSADVVQGDGKIYRIEPTAGITNRAAYEAKYRNKARILIQDDKTFYAAINRCSVGIIYSVILQASPRYSLIVKRVFFDKLEDARRQIEPIIKAQCAEHGPWQLDLWVMPKSKKTMLVIHEKIPYDRNIRSIQPPGFWDIIGAWIGNRFWEMAYNVPYALEVSLDLLLSTQETKPEGDKLDWRHYMGGNIPALKMMATEKMIDYHGDANNFDAKFIDHVNTIGEKTKDLFYNSPMGIRFVGASKHCLSMFKKEGIKRFVSFEQPFVPHSQHGQRILRIIDDVLSEGRTHWGQNNLLTENPNQITQTYGQDLVQYLATRQQLIQGKPNRFELPRDINTSLAAPVDPSRYYRIRENTLGGYLTIWTGATQVPWLAREAYQDNLKQYFYFTPLGEGWYHIRTINHKYWTVEHGGYGLHAISFKDSPQGDGGKRSRFRLDKLKDGSFRIHELTANELLSIGDGGTWNGFCIRHRPANNTPDRQRFWLHDAGPITH